MTSFSFLSFTFKKPTTLVRNLLLVSLAFHLTCACFNVGYYTPDEYFQISEFTSYKSGKTPLQDLPWEFESTLRPAMQPAFMYLVMKATGLINPVAISFVMRLISSIVAWAVYAFFILVCLRLIRSAQIKKAVLYLSFLLWFFPFAHARFSSENWSAVFFYAAFTLILLIQSERRKPEKHFPGVLFLSGILFGLSYAIHFQSAIMIGSIVAWLLVSGRISFREMSSLFTGIFLAAVTGIVIDRWFYGKWVFAAWNYFKINILEGKTSDFGVSPWWNYFNMLFANLVPPFSIAFLLLIAIFFIRFPKHVFTFICLPFFLLHVLTAHKEMRFLLPLAPMLPIMAGLALDGPSHLHWVEKIRTLFRERLSKKLFSIFLALNVTLMVISCLLPANENFLFYEFMYRKYNGKPLTLYSFSGDPFSCVGLPVDFFKPHPLRIITLTADSISDAYPPGGDSLFVFAYKGLRPDTIPFFRKNNLHEEYRNIPDFIQKINLGNRLRIAPWMIYTAGSAESHFRLKR